MLLIVGRFYIQPCAALAGRDFFFERRLMPVWRIEPRHLRTGTGEQTSGYRSGNNPRQIEHPNAGQRPAARQTPVDGIEAENR